MHRIELDEAMAPATALQAIVAACLREQVLPHVAALVDGSDAAPRRVHRLRVGLRRLRSALRLFGRWAGIETADLDRWDRSLARYARPLGEVRDLDVLGDEARGADRARLLRGAVVRLRGPAFGRLMLELATAPAAGSAAAVDDPPLKRLARRRLKKFQRRLRREAARFAAAGADDEARHRLRKRLKRLRDGIDLLAALLPQRRTRRRLQRLRRVQDALGRYNDARVALQLRVEQGADVASVREAVDGKARRLRRAELAVARWRRSG